MILPEHPLYLRALEVFGLEDSVKHWFSTPLIALGGKSPNEFVDQGKEQEVENLLNRIEYGIFS